MMDTRHIYFFFMCPKNLNFDIKIKLLRFIYSDG